MSDEAIKAMLNPALMPRRAPIDFQAMSADAFRQFLEQTTDYKEVRKFGGANEWRIAGVFTCKDTANGNAVSTRLALCRDDALLAFIDLSPAASLAIARTLIEHAIGDSNLNGEPQTGADGLLDLFKGFLTTEALRGLVECLTAATSEIVTAELKLRAAGVR
jgi:hypothetical protein